jgi:hypothetical protein
MKIACYFLSAEVLLKLICDFKEAPWREDSEDVDLYAKKIIPLPRLKKGGGEDPLETPRLHENQETTVAWLLRCGITNHAKFQLVTLSRKNHQRLIFQSCAWTECIILGIETKSSSD